LFFLREREKGREGGRKEGRKEGRKKGREGGEALKPYPLYQIILS
jgi:predicted transposase YdaD